MATDQENKLLKEIEDSIKNMQTQMQSTYTELAEKKLIGESSDGSVQVIMSATYSFEDIIFTEQALKGGIKEFKWRIREAWKDLSEKIQKTTQEQTMALLQGMQIPDEIKNLTTGDNGDDN